MIRVLNLRSPSQFLAGVLLGLALVGGVAPSSARAAGTVRVALGPSVTTAMIADHLRDAGIWKKWGRRAGVDFEVTPARDTMRKLVQRGADAVLLSTIDVARLVVDDGFEVVMWGKDSTSYEGLYASAGQAGEDPRGFRGMRLVHPGWNTRGTRIGQVVLALVWGLRVDADFRVVTAPWRIGPEKLAEGEADVALNAMPFVLRALRKKRLRPVGRSFAAEWAEKRGDGRRLGGLFWAGRRAWLDRETKKARALLAAWAEGMAYANRETGAWAQKRLPRVLHNASKDDVRFFVRWFRRERPVYETPYLTKKDVEDETSFLRLAVREKLVRKLPDKPLWRILSPP